MIPTIRAEGTHAEVGAAVGLATAAAIRRRTDLVAQSHLQQAAGYRVATEEHLPWVLEELDAAADAAGVDRLALFAASVEELSSAPRGCTDVVADGVVAHTNDLDAADEDDVVAIEWAVEGEPRLFTLGIGPWLSVGWNESRAVRHRQRALAERRARRRPPAAADARRRAAADARSRNRRRAPPGAGVLVQLGARDAGGRSATSRGRRRMPASGGPTPSCTRTTTPSPRCSATRRSRRTRAHTAATAVPWSSSAGADPRERSSAITRAAICRHGDPDGTKTVFWCVADLRAGRVRVRPRHPV